MFHNQTFEDQDLRGVNFSRLDLSMSNFYGCNLSGANFEGAILHSTSFIECDLSETNFSFVDLYGTEFILCNIERAVFTRAVFRGVTSANSQFLKSKFTDCLFYGSELGPMRECALYDCQSSTSEFKELADSTWNANPVSNVVTITGLDYPVTFLGDKLSIGCQTESLEWFESESQRTAASLEGLKSARFWRKFRDPILDFAKKLR